MTADPVGQRLASFAEELAASLPGMVEVEANDALAVVLHPKRPDALGLAWHDDGEGLQVETLGGPGGRWELGRTEADAALLEDIVRSVVAGRVVEVFGGPDRSRVSVTLAAGTTEVETGYEGLSGFLPVPAGVDGAGSSGTGRTAGKSRAALVRRDHARKAIASSGERGTDAVLPRCSRPRQHRRPWDLAPGLIARGDEYNDYVERIVRWREPVTPEPYASGTRRPTGPQAGRLAGAMEAIRPRG